MSRAIISDVVVDWIASDSKDEEIGGDTSSFTRQLSTQGYYLFTDNFYRSLSPLETNHLPNCNN
jgi:hypothetical protein